MSATPDRFPGEREEEGIILIDDGSGDPPSTGGMRYVSGAFRLRDSVGVYDPRSGFSALHQPLRHLIHFVDDGPAYGFPSGCYRETIGGVFSSSEIWWESAAKLKKIVSLDITRDVQQKPTAEVWKAYATDGITVVETLTDTITYSGVFETSRTRLIA